MKNLSWTWTLLFLNTKILWIFLKEKNLNVLETEKKNQNNGLTITVNQIKTSSKTDLWLRVAYNSKFIRKHITEHSSSINLITDHISGAELQNQGARDCDINMYEIPASIMNSTSIDQTSLFIHPVCYNIPTYLLPVFSGYKHLGLFYSNNDKRSTFM